MGSATPAAATQDLQQLTLGDCLARLGEINRELAKGNMDVEAALSLFEEGIALHERADSILSKARLRVTELLDSGGLKHKLWDPTRVPRWHARWCHPNSGSSVRAWMSLQNPTNSLAHRQTGFFRGIHALTFHHVLASTGPVNPSLPHTHLPLLPTRFFEAAR